MYRWVTPDRQVITSKYFWGLIWKYFWTRLQKLWYRSLEIARHPKYFNRNDAQIDKMNKL